LKRLITVAPAASTATSAATAVSAAATTAASGAASATATAATFTLGTRFIDDDLAAFEISAVQGRDGLFRFAVIIDFDKSETTKLTGEAIADESDSTRGNTVFRE
jgi:hypothetical protein